MNAVEKLRSLVVELRSAPHPALKKETWELAARLMGRMPVSAAEIDRVCGSGDVDGLDALVRRIEGPPAGAKPAPAASGPPVSPEMAHEMEMALRAFRKRLKVMRLADESKLRGRRLSSGKSSEIDAIEPPKEFGPEVWRALARAGKLKDTGAGFYALAAGA